MTPPPTGTNAWKDASVVLDMLAESHEVRITHLSDFETLLLRH
jgi:hypothetical protein